MSVYALTLDGSCPKSLVVMLLRYHNCDERNNIMINIIIMLNNIGINLSYSSRFMMSTDFCLRALVMQPFRLLQ